MPAQNRTFVQAKAEAEARRQEAHRAANAAFDAERARITAARTALYESARDAFAAVKSTPDHPDHDAAKAEFDRVSSLPASYHAAHQALDAAIHAADAEFSSTLDRLHREQLARDLADAVPNEPIR